MSFKTVLHPTQSPKISRNWVPQRHNCGLPTMAEAIQSSKIHLLIKRRWLAGSKECNLLDDLISDFLNVGQKVCRLPHPSPSKRRQVKPKMESPDQSKREMRNHTFSQWGTESYSDSLYETELHLSTKHNHTPTQARTRISKVKKYLTTSGNDIPVPDVAFHILKHCLYVSAK